MHGFFDFVENGVVLRGDLIEGVCLLKNKRAGGSAAVGSGEGRGGMRMGVGYRPSAVFSMRDGE